MEPSESTSAALADPTAQPVSLVDLPEECLLQILSRCAAAAEVSESADSDATEAVALATRTLCSAARAHSRLYTAAVSVLHNISVEGITEQQQLGGVLSYLSRHSQHVHSLSLAASVNVNYSYYSNVALLQLPPLPHLTSLSLQGLVLQLLPKSGSASCDGGDGSDSSPYAPATAAAAADSIDQQQQGQQQGGSGVLQALSGAPLGRLQLDMCTLLDGSAGLQSLAASCPQLESISLSNSLSSRGDSRVAAAQQGDGQQRVHVAGEWLQQLAHLTQLDVSRDSDVLAGPHPTAHVVGLTGLRDLRLRLQHKAVIKVSELAPLQHLTQLQLHCVLGGVEAAGLENLSKLQHLYLYRCSPVAVGAPHTARPAGVAALLSALHSLTRLTHLALPDSLQVCCESPAAYSALTASSSRLQCLNLKGCRVPPTAWEQHIMMQHRRRSSLNSSSREQQALLPQLRVLNAYVITSVANDSHSSGLGRWDITSIVSCCPGLRQLSVAVATPDLAPLGDLRELQQLGVKGVDAAGVEVIAAVCTGLRQLELETIPFATDSGKAAAAVAAAFLQPLTSLTTLTEVKLLRRGAGRIMFTCKAPGDRPVCQQLAQHCRQPSSTALRYLPNWLAQRLQGA